MKTCNYCDCTLWLWLSRISLKHLKYYFSLIIPASANAYYIYEPFQKMKLNHTRIDVFIDDNDDLANDVVRKRLMDMFNCQFQPKANKRKSKMSTQCSESSSRVIKTIRVRYNTLKSWIQDTDIKVFFLFPILKWHLLIVSDYTFGSWSTRNT